MMDATEEISELFTCPVCRNIMTTPIHMCIVGHSFCVDCYQRITECPECRESVGTLRNYAMERIQEHFSFSCTNLDEGCTFKSSSMNIKKHEKFCGYSLRRCPLKLLNDCKWTGRRNNMLSHALECHHRNTVETPQCTFKCPVTIEGNCCMIFLNAFEKQFLCLWQYDSIKKNINWSVLYMGPVMEAEDYHFAILFEDPMDATKSIRYKGKCHTAENCDLNRTDFHFNINISDLSRFIKDDCFYYTVSVGTNRVNQSTPNNQDQEVVSTAECSGFTPISPMWITFLHFKNE